MRLLLVLAGGALGSGGRYLVSVWMAERFGGAFPWGTLTVNLAGCFLIGLIATLADEFGRIGAGTRVFLVAGVLGGFTTFSSFALEAWRLAETDHELRALLYVGGSLALGLTAAVLGTIVGRAVV